jgi:hypothetical protein
MKNTAILVTLLCLLGLPLNAQEYLSTIKYATSLPLADTEDYIDSYSWKGFEVGTRSYLSRNSSFGFMVGWNVFDKRQNGTFMQDNVTITGTQIRYINAFPVMLNTHYYTGRKRGTRLFVGINAGTYYVEQRTSVGLFAVTDANWHLGVAPEIGLMIPAGDSHLDLTARYNYAFEAGGIGPVTYLGLNIGFTFTH